MPLVRVSLQQGRTTEQKRVIADAIYEAMRETIGIPEGDRFIALHEHSGDALLVDPAYMEIERTEGIALIEITFRRGRTPAMKKALFARIAERLHQQAGMRKEDVFVVLHENESPDWSFGNGLAQYLTD